LPETFNCRWRSELLLNLLNEDLHKFRFVYTIARASLCAFVDVVAAEVFSDSIIFNLAPEPSPAIDASKKSREQPDVALVASRTRPLPCPLFE